jgi:hypothetical protein
MRNWEPATRRSELPSQPCLSCDYIILSVADGAAALYLSILVIL